MARVASREMEVKSISTKAQEALKLERES